MAPRRGLTSGAGPDHTSGSQGSLSLGYGSLGTGSLADLETGLIGAGSTALSVELPLSTGLLLPGSTGSIGQ